MDNLTFDEIKFKADNGDKDAQHYIADMYYNGDRCEKNYKNAFKYYKPLADDGNQDAQYITAQMYYDGNGCEKNYKNAFKYYKLLAEQNNPIGQYYLSEMYHRGDGCNKSSQMAFKYCKLAADNELNTAKHQLGVLYQLGVGVNVNFELALKCYEESESDTSKYENLCKTMIDNKNNQTNCIKYISEQFEKLNKSSVDYQMDNIGNASSLKKCSSCNNPITNIIACSGCLTHVYCNIDCQQSKWVDHKENCKNWGELLFASTMHGAVNGDVEKLFKMGMLFENGTGIEKNNTTSLKWYKRAADKGHGQAQMKLANEYENNNDISNACEYYKLASDNGIDGALDKYNSLI
jgi:TPR repeat protein